MKNRVLARRSAAVAGATALVVGAWAVAGNTASAAQPPAPTKPGPERKVARGDKLGEHDRDLLAEAQARGVRKVTVLLATDKGAAKDTTARVRKLGGTVGAANDKVGYVRATLPPAAVTKAAGLSAVLAVDLNESFRLPDPRAEARSAPKVGKASTRSSTTVAAVPAPGPKTPDVNPYLPTHETGAVAFKQQHPTADGRGVTIGILDSGVDLDHPALAKTTTGQRKIVDWVTATDPIIDSDPTWRAMLTTVTGPQFTAAGEQWTAPAGSFQFNRFSEAGLGGEVGGDVNRDGDTTDRFGVLYDATTHDIWVDADQDHDFTDQPAMRPYAEKFQVGHFGTDNPATGVREQIPFVVQYREDVDLTPAGLPGQKADFVNIGIPEGAHGSHVAGIAAGNRLFGGYMDGAAPGAKIVSARACTFPNGGCTATALIEGMIDLVVNKHVDVVNMSIGGLPALNDGANARAVLYNRLINDYGVQLFLSAGNSGPGMNTVGDPSVATDVVSVGASVSKATWKSNYGSDVSSPLNMFNFSSRGPREDGGLKPDITAPGSAISTVPTWQPGQPVAEAGYELPAGYAMFNGTSMAAPQATGAAALLLSATKAKGIPVTPAQLRQAIYTSARYNPAVTAAAQGSGGFDVPGAWDLLKGGTLPTPAYTVSAPVCTPISSLLTTPNAGPGIYNRCAADAGGHAPGQAKDYTITVTRNSGPAGNRLHTLTWLGNDGTFTAPQVAVLPLGQPRTITVRAKPSAGVHSAFLRIDDPGTAGLDARVLNTVIASTPLASPSFGWSTSSTVERNRYRSYFVTVPPGAAALQVNLSGIATASQTRFIAINPYGVPMEDTSSLVCYTNFSDPKACNPVSRAYANPLPGVWEIEVESRRTSPFLTNPFRLAAAAQGVKVEPPLVELDSVQAGQPAPVSWKLTNTFGPVTVTPKGGPLGSGKLDRPTIAGGETHTYTVDVPAGSSKLDVAIGNPSDLSADLDLTVFKDGVQVGQSADGDSEEAVSIANPAAGTYTVEVFGYAVPAGTTQYDYRDVFYAASLGSLAVPATPLTLANGASATVTGSLTAQTAPAAGRQLFGELTVVTGEGAVVGRSNVVVRNVTTSTAAGSGGAGGAG